MYVVLNFLWEMFKLLFIFIIGMLVFICFVLVHSGFEKERQKKECYEIYATDNIKLKKCERFFEEE